MPNSIRKAPGPDDRLLVRSRASAAWAYLVAHPHASADAPAKLAKIFGVEHVFMDDILQAIVDDRILPGRLPSELTDEIEDELARAQAKFPGTRLATLALMEEVGELAEAQLKHGRGHPRVREEAIQVIVVALRIILEGDSSVPVGGIEPAKGGAQ